MVNLAQQQVQERLLLQQAGLKRVFIRGTQFSAARSGFRTPEGEILSQQQALNFARRAQQDRLTQQRFAQIRADVEIGQRQRTLDRAKTQSERTIAGSGGIQAPDPSGKRRQQERQTALQEQTQQRIRSDAERVRQQELSSRQQVTTGTTFNVPITLSKTVFLKGESPFQPTAAQQTRVRTASRRKAEEQITAVSTKDPLERSLFRLDRSAPFLAAAGGAVIGARNVVIGGTAFLGGARGAGVVGRALLPRATASITRAATSKAGQSVTFAGAGVFSLSSSFGLVTSGSPSKVGQGAVEGVVGLGLAASGFRGLFSVGRDVRTIISTEKLPLASVIAPSTSKRLAAGLSPDFPSLPSSIPASRRPAIIQEQFSKAGGGFTVSVEPIPRTPAGVGRALTDPQKKELGLGLSEVPGIFIAPKLSLPFARLQGESTAVEPSLLLPKFGKPTALFFETEVGRLPTGRVEQARTLVTKRTEEITSQLIQQGVKPRTARSRAKLQATQEGFRQTFPETAAGRRGGTAEVTLTAELGKTEIEATVQPGTLFKVSPARQRINVRGQPIPIERAKIISLRQAQRLTPRQRARIETQARRSQFSSSSQNIERSLVRSSRPRSPVTALRSSTARPTPRSSRIITPISSSPPVSVRSSSPAVKRIRSSTPTTTSRTIPTAGRSTAPVSPVSASPITGRSLAPVSSTSRALDNNIFNPTRPRPSPPFRPFRDRTTENSRGLRVTRRQPRAFTPTVLAAGFGIRGTPTGAGIRTGFGLRPIQPKKKKKKKKSKK